MFVYRSVVMYNWRVYMIGLCMVQSGGGEGVCALCVLPCAHCVCALCTYL
jgi:hypothetical protein